MRSATARTEMIEGRLRVTTATVDKLSINTAVWSSVTE